MTPLRQRMIQDMQARNLAPHTQRAYLQHVSQFARHFRKSPELLGPTEIHAFQLHLARERKLAASSIRVAVAAIRFLDNVTLHPQPAKERRMTPLRQRMIEDMQIRNLTPHTQTAYLQYVSQFACHFHKSPELLGPNEMRACKAVGFITPPMRLPRRRLQGGSRHSDDRRRPREYRSAPLFARRGRAAPLPCSRAFAASCSCVWQ